jgi:hypothetical protein
MKRDLEPQDLVGQRRAKALCLTSVVSGQIASEIWDASEN